MQHRFLLQILLLAQHVSGHHNAHHQELKSIIQWLLPVVFSAVVFKLLVWCRTEGYVSGLQHAGLLQILLFGQHVSGTTMPIIRSSRVLYSGCCLWYFVLWFSSCWSGVELRVICQVCRMLVYWQEIRSAIKTSVASSWHFISTHLSLFSTEK